MLNEIKSASGRKNIFLYPLALVCIICPLCIIARAKPHSVLAKFVGGLSKICPFCLAYKKLKQNTEKE